MCVFSTVLFRRWGGWWLWPVVVKFQKSERVWFVNPIGSVVRLTRKGLVFNVLNSSFDLSSYRLLETIVFGCMSFDSLMFPRLLSSAGFKELWMPILWYLLERTFTLAACSGRCWHLDSLPCWRSTHSPFLNPNCFCKSSFFIFFFL